MANAFFTLSSAIDDIGSVQDLAPLPDFNHPNTVAMKFDGSPETFNISNDAKSFNLLKVARNGAVDDSITNFDISFNTQEYFLKDGLNFISVISFLTPVSADAISNLINQLDLSKINASSGPPSDVDGLMSDIKSTLEKFPQYQLVEIFNTTLSETTKDLSDVNNKITLYNDPVTRFKVTDSISDLNSQKNKDTQIINTLNNLLSPNGSQQLPLVLKSRVDSNFNKFRADYFTQYNFVYQSLVESGQISDTTQRSKNSSGINQASSGTSASPGLAVDPTNQALAAQTNLILGQNQIITVIGISGTNVFGPHQSFDNTLSILDVMRNENEGVAFTSDIVVKQNIGNGTDTGDDQTVCSQLFSKFSVSDINQMIKSLQNKLQTNTTTATKILVALKRTQSTAEFQFTSAFSGYRGINFTKLDTLNLGSFDFSGAIAGAKNAARSIQNISISDVGGQFGQAVSQITGAVSDQASRLYKNTLGSMNSVDFKRVFDQIDPDALRKCPSLSQIKSIMQNPDAAVNSQLTKTAQGASQVTKSYGSQLTNLQSVSAENTDIQNQINQLQNLLKTMNP